MNGGQRSRLAVAGPSQTREQLTNMEHSQDKSNEEQGQLRQVDVGRRVLIPRGWAGVWGGEVVGIEGNELLVKVDVQPDIKRCLRRHAQFLT